MILVRHDLIMAMGYRAVDRDQLFLLPPAMTDWLADDHVVWFLIEAVQQMDTSAFHGQAKLGGVGRRPYDPDVLLTLWVYAMAAGQRSSRAIERLCGTDLAFKIICADDVPDHTVLAKFRKTHESAIEDVLTESLVLAKKLGFINLGVVALDGTKIAANASKEANRSENTLRKLAAQHLAEAAATDDVEDDLFGEDSRGDEVPDKLRDKTRRGRRIRDALDAIKQRKDADAATADAAQKVAAQYSASAADPDRPAPRGRPPAGADPVAMAAGRLARERQAAQQRCQQWQAKADAAAAQGHKMPGTPPAAPDEQVPVKRARAAYEQAKRDTSAEPANGSGQNTRGKDSGEGKGPKANMTDPQSRLLKTRFGFIQGYNAQAAASDDGFIVYADPTQDANDVGQFQPTLDAVQNIAGTIAGRTGTKEGLDIGTVLADAGYDSEDNITVSDGEPDRLIPDQKRRDLATQPDTTGDPPEGVTAREAMNHRLRTAEGRDLYAKRAHLIETPNAWIKDNRGLRRFARRGQTAARSELNLAAGVTNLLRLRAKGITTSQLAQLTT